MKTIERLRKLASNPATAEGFARNATIDPSEADKILLIIDAAYADMSNAKARGLSLPNIESALKEIEKSEPVTGWKS